ncbi:hypothetical protein BBJ28_00003706 [Nothophytophthora sp. Chile5]|nr:hypothetical protein BBJ28_00003706 [Nothophytophthora sp. Chile5]
MAVFTTSYAVLLPPELQHFEGAFQNTRGQSLFYFALFPPVRHTLRGVVLCLHGLGDHCRRYIFLYERLCEAGFGVISYDMVNHGASDCDSHRTRGHVRNFRHLVEDTNSFITFAKRSIFPQIEDPTPRLIISGASFGALLGMHTVLSGRHKFHAAFWAGALVGVEMTAAWKIQATFVQPLALLVPTARIVAPVNYELLWRDPGCLEDFQSDALATTSDMTARTGQQVLSAMNRLLRDKCIGQKGSDFCAVHMLFLSGSEDHIASPSVIRQFFYRLGNSDKELKVFEGVFHSVLEDPERDEVVAYLVHWLRQRCPKPQSVDAPVA